MSTPSLGPASTATLVAASLDQCSEVYGTHLHQRVFAEAPLSAEEAEWLGWPDLAGTRTAWLANALDEPWLRLIENPQAGPGAPFHRHGWLSLEIAVADVDALGAALDGSPLEIIGAPADLEMSSAIRAMQAIGPCGEVLYLTEIKAEVPGFELPRARCAVDRLFIPVMTCPDRADALSFYSGLSGNEGLQFETRVTVLNGALGLPIDTRHPLATLQLRGDTLIELDQVPDLAPSAFGPGLPPAGIASIGFGTTAALPDTPRFTRTDGPLAGRECCRLQGAAGEWIELHAENRGEPPCMIND